ncbi:cyclic nucleotide-binding domain-containing protein [Candidatus Poribacteria bacterium]|nr:cyclic nucleotide-binding domain-containing protein [Candidatus Poribacteria bacterium]
MPSQSSDIPTPSARHGVSPLALQNAVDRLGLARVAHLLSRSELFHGLAPEILTALAAECSLIATYQGQTLIEEGETGSDVMLLISGRVSVHLESISPAIEVCITKLGAGEVFGEMALLGNDLRSATVVASEPCEVLRIPGALLKAMIDENSAAGMTLMRNLSALLAERLRIMNRRLLNLMRTRYF